jgi:eukaryotic-like serine/threonine-protein kinase
MEVPGQIDHYSLDHLIATSTTACIYRGTDLHTGCEVAVKIPHLALEGDALFYNRLRRERQVGEKLDHPSIAKFFPDTKRSRAYIVMEWAQGRSLRQILIDSETKALPPYRALSLAVKLCDALEYLHSQGVVHRDLKPENIIVDDADNIKLIDFGLASLTGAGRLTFGKLSQVMGTPDYISPEQVRGKRGDPRSDIYALGVILYEMLAGSMPFPGDNPLAIMNLRLLEPPVPPREANPEITPALQEIIYRALEKDPEKRYASAREFSWDLRHQDRVGIEDRLQPAGSRHPPVSRIAAALRYVRMTLLPLSVFALLLYAARHT